MFLFKKLFKLEESFNEINIENERFKKANVIQRDLLSEAESKNKYYENYLEMTSKILKIYSQMRIYLG